MDDRAGHREDHAELRQQHAAPCRLGMRQSADAEDEEQGRYEVEDLDGDVHGQRPPPFFFLNILSMGSVMRNPPTTLIVAASTATKPRIVVSTLASLPAITTDTTRKSPRT